MSAGDHQAPPHAPSRRRLPLGCVILLWVALTVGLVAAWGALSLTGRDPRLLWYQYQPVDTVHVTRVRADANLVASGAKDGFGGAMIPLDQTIKDAHAAQALYTAAFDLPAPIFFEQYSCVLGSPIIYHLAFSRARFAVASVDVDLEGCANVSLAGVATRKADGQFLRLLADTLHISETDLYSPFAPYTGPAIPPITVTIQRIGERPGVHITPLFKDITDPTVGFALDNDIVAYSSYGGSSYLPPASECPPNDGIVYRFTFYENGARVGVRDIEATGCQLVFSYDGDGFPPEHIINPAFWQALAKALGVPEQSLGVGPTAVPPTGSCYRRLSQRAECAT